MKHSCDTDAESRFDFRPGDSPYPKTSDLFGRGSHWPSFAMWIDCRIELARTKCVFRSVKAGHAPNQISPARNQISWPAVYIGSVIIDRSLTKGEIEGLARISSNADLIANQILILDKSEHNLICGIINIVAAFYPAVHFKFQRQFLKLFKKIAIKWNRD